jgi:hypothetical protein
LISGKASIGAAASTDVVFCDFLANNFSFNDIFFSILTFGLIISFFFSTNSSLTGSGDFSSFLTSTGA